MSDHRSPAAVSPASTPTELSGITLGVPPLDKNRPSPALSTFSLEPSPDAKVTLYENLVDRKDSTRQTLHGGHGPRCNPGAAQQKTQYYEEQFAYKDTAGQVRNRVNSDSPVIAELRTNVIVKDEYSLVTNLSRQFSIRYQRPESCILVTVAHSACVMLGGSFDPTYLLVVSALAPHVQPTTNKRNAALIQTTLAGLLSVPPHRGIIKFQSIEEQNLAIDGKTILGEIERLEKQEAKESGGGLKRALTKSSRKSLRSQSKSSPQLLVEDFDSPRQSPSALAKRSPTKPKMYPRSIGRVLTDNENSENDQLGPLLAAESLPWSSSVNHARVWASGGTQTSKRSPILEEESAPKIGKRRSFLAVFKR